MAKSTAKVKVLCPNCEATLVIDRETGLVFQHEPKRTDFSFEEAVQDVQARKSRSDEIFQKAYENEKQRHEALEKKFRQALESQDELEEPQKPWEFD